jgi:hypothetical protein
MHLKLNMSDHLRDATRLLCPGRCRGWGRVGAGAIRFPDVSTQLVRQARVTSPMHMSSGWFVETL